MKKLTLLTGSTYAIGSIVGSGILFLPSLTYQVSGSSVLTSWGLATLLCIPLIIMFNDMSKQVPNGSGVKGFISLGLGEKTASILPILMLSTVIVGMPSSGIIVGKFVSDYFQIQGIEYLIAIFLLGFGLITNYAGKSLGAKIQMLISFLFVIVALVVFFVTLKPAVVNNSLDKLTLFNPDVFQGITLAFWAFAGFENLSFMTNDFKNPKKDFLKSMIIALIVCGALYLAITFNYVSIIEKDNIKSVMGLYQLTEHISPKNISTLIITIFAVFALATNFNSWIRGLSSMIEKSSADSDLPRFLKTDDNNGRRAIILLALLFSITLSIQYLKPDFLEIALKTVSSNFVVIYILTTTSFIIKASNLTKRLMGIVTLLILSASLVSDYEKLIYPIAICSIYFVFKSIVSSRRTKNA